MNTFYGVPFTVYGLPDTICDTREMFARDRMGARA
jgi:hypothetical protein